MKNIMFGIIITTSLVYTSVVSCSELTKETYTQDEVNDLLDTLANDIVKKFVHYCNTGGTITIGSEEFICVNPAKFEDRKGPRVKKKQEYEL